MRDNIIYLRREEKIHKYIKIKIAGNTLKAGLDDLVEKHFCYADLRLLTSQ